MDFLEGDELLPLPAAGYFAQYRAPADIARGVAGGSGLDRGFGQGSRSTLFRHALVEAYPMVGPWHRQV